MRYTLDEIETFLAVMELGSVTAASARLNLSKSVVSKRIADLERALGAALFLRSAGRIAPTEAAQGLAERLRPALSELRAAAEGAAWGMDGPVPLRGRLAIAAPMSFGTLHLGPILARCGGPSRARAQDRLRRPRPRSRARGLRSRRSRRRAARRRAHRQVALHRQDGRLRQPRLPRPPRPVGDASKTASPRWPPLRAA
jgi:hypothetical protein